jgi:hypothetical protein
MARRHLILPLVCITLSGCAGRGQLGDPVRVSELRWRACPTNRSTEVTNGGTESIRVIVSEGPTGSPTPMPAISVGVVQRGEIEIFDTIGPTMRFIEIAPVERPTELNGNIRRPNGYDRVQIRCLAR